MMETRFLYVFVIALVVALIISAVYKQESLEDTSSIDPNFIIEQAYYNSLGSLQKRMYKAAPSLLKISLINDFTKRNSTIATRARNTAAANIAKQAMSVARAATQSVMATSVKNTMSKVLEDSNIDNTIRDIVSNLSSTTVQSVVESVSDAVDRKLSKEESSAMIESRLRQALKDAIATSTSTLEEPAKAAAVDKLQLATNTIVANTIADLSANFAPTVAADKEAVFATASAMTAPITMPIWDGSEMIQFVPFVTIVNNAVVVDLNKTKSIVMEQINGIVNKRIADKRLTKKQANDILAKESEVVSTILTSRVKAPDSLAFAAANIAVKLV